MRGTQLLSALLKVNPFFTIALAVGFTGVAGLGLNHVDSISLKKLIPLHIKSFFAGDAPRAGTDIPDFEIAQHTMQELFPWLDGPEKSGNVAPSAPAFVPPAPARLTWDSFPKVPAQPVASRPGPSQPATSSSANLGPDQPASKTDQAMAGNPYSAYSAPHNANDAAGVTTPNYPNFSFPAAPQRFAAQAPAIRPVLTVPPVKPVIITPVEVPDVLPIPLPVVEPSLPGRPSGIIPYFPPYVSPVQDPPISADPIVVTPEPPIHLLFAGIVALLVGLRHRATRNNGLKTASN